MIVLATADAPHQFLLGFHGFLAIVLLGSRTTPVDCVRPAVLAVAAERVSVDDQMTSTCVEIIVTRLISWDYVGSDNFRSSARV